MLSCTSKRSHRHTILHVSFSNSFGLASARPTPQGLSGAPLFVSKEMLDTAFSKDDSVHNLLRHIRNAIAHGLVVAENRQKLSIKDKTKNGRLTLEGKIPNRLFYELLEALLSTRNNKTH